MSKVRVDTADVRDMGGKIKQEGKTPEIPLVELKISEMTFATQIAIVNANSDI